MSAEENMALARRFLEARVAKRDLDAVGEMLATDFVNHNRLLPGKNPIARVTCGQSLLITPPSLRATLERQRSQERRARCPGHRALAASRNERLATVDPEVGSEALRLLSERREDLVAERTRALNRLHGLLRDLVPGGAAGTLSAHRAARILRGIRPQGASDRLRRRLASEILRLESVRWIERSRS